MSLKVFEDFVLSHFFSAGRFENENKSFPNTRETHFFLV